MRKVNSDSKCLFIKAKEEKQTERKKKNVQRKKRHLMTVRQLADYKSSGRTQLCRGSLYSRLSVQNECDHVISFDKKRRRKKKVK